MKSFLEFISETKIAPAIYVLVGPPGSGKSTWISKNFSKNDPKTAILSTDYYIEKAAKEQGKLYNDVFRDEAAEAHRKFHIEVAKAIKENKNIVWDQTNIKESDRLGIIKSTPKYYKKIAVVFNLPREEVEKRLAQREKETGKHIPPFVVDSMFNNFTLPTKEEGFDKIIFVK